MFLGLAGLPAQGGSAIPHARQRRRFRSPCPTTKRRKQTAYLALEFALSQSNACLEAASRVLEQRVVVRVMLLHTASSSSASEGRNVCGDNNFQKEEFCSG